MIHKYLVAAAVLGSIAASAAVGQTVRDGFDAWTQGDYGRAIVIWRPLAEKGDPDAAFDLGQAYRWGRGVPINLSAAITWLSRAALKGHVGAQVTLGLLLFDNGDHEEGLKWLKIASEKGEPRAMFVYGAALVNGTGAPRNVILGYAYISRSAAQGIQPAKDMLAHLDQLLPADLRAKALALAKASAAPEPSAKRGRPAKVLKAKRPAPAEVASAAPAPAATPAPIAASAAIATGAWRIQLGAFSQRASAEALYKRLSANGALAGRHAFYIPVGAVTRLQAGPFESKAAAASACKALATACFPVPAK